MAERSTLARPYARAAFEVAEAEGDLGRWSGMLDLVAVVVADDQLEPVLSDPTVEPEDLAALITDVAGDRLDANGANLVKLLAENRRLALMPEIVELFAELRNEAERVVDVEVRAASELDQATQDRYVEALRKRLGRDVRLNCIVDDSLLGGAVITAGDLVIDGTVGYRLDRLARTITS